MAADAPENSMLDMGTQVDDRYGHPPTEHIFVKLTYNTGAR